MNFAKNKINGGYQLYCLELNTEMSAVNIRENKNGLEAEICIQYPDNGEFIKKDNILLHLQRNDDRRKLARDLSEDIPIIPWSLLIDEFCGEVIKLYRSCAVLQDASQEPEITYFPSMVDGLAIPVGTHTAIFSPGGKGKTNISYYLATLIQYGIVPESLPLAPRQGNVLILDWESSIDVARIYFKAIRKGLGITEPQRMNYIECDRSIFDMKDELFDVVYENDIEFIIIDSQMAATAGGVQYQNEAERASAYFNVLNSLKCTTLTIDHATKDMMKSQDMSSGTAFGSVVKYNRVRSQYELRSQQETESDHLEFVLVHQKYNLGRKLLPIGISIDFVNVAGELQEIKYSHCNINDNPDLERSQPVRIRIINWLKENTKGTVDSIADEIGAPKDQVRVTLNREKKDFLKLMDGSWVLLQKT